MTVPQEKALVFRCGKERLIGILHGPGGELRPVGVLIVVGGPQYRAGSHRQFVLMAREIARAGHPVLRFDHRGIGDSDGTARSFEELDDDIRVALDLMYAQYPALRGVVIMGLCDAASAALMYCSHDPRVAGLILANPWVRSEAGQARAYVRHYYGNRLLQAAFWRKFAAGQVDFVGSVRDFLRKLRTSSRGRDARESRASFQERMLAGLVRFDGPVLLQISGRDLTAAEFMDMCGSDPRWSSAIARPSVDVRRYERADHTFAEGLGAATADCAAWLGTVTGR
jgi:exosortase A-associated hydrolase 1